MANHPHTTFFMVLCASLVAHGQVPPPVIPASPPPVVPAESAEKPPVPVETPVPEKPASTPAETDPDSVLFPPILPGEKPQLPRSPARKKPSALPIFEPDPALSQELAPDEPQPTEAGTPLVDPVFQASEDLRQRFAMDQALGTGEALLGDLSGVRGVLSSPFAARTRPDGPKLRLGAFDLQPRISVGVAYTHRSEGGENEGENQDGEGDGDGGNFDPFFQAGILAAFQRGQLSGVLGYAIGLNPQAGGDGRGGSDQSNDLGQDLYLTTSFRLPQVPRIEFGFGLNFSGLSGVNRDVGGEAERSIATASLGASYAYSQKTSFDLDLSLPIRDFSDGISSTGATATFFVNNQITQKTQIGLGVSYGTLDSEVSGSGDFIRSAEDFPDGTEGESQTFQRILFRINSSPSKLFSFAFTGGLEFRDSGGYSEVNPTFGASARWTPRPATSVSLAAEQRGFGSASSFNTNYTSTSFSLTVNQRLGYRLNGSLTLGYEHADYYSVGEGGDDGRKDDLLHASASLNLPISNRWSWQLTFTVSDNQSNTNSFRYYQAVLQTSYAF